MIIKNFSISADVHIHCKSNFYSAFSTLSPNNTCTFNTGINTNFSDINSSLWGIGYLISMYKYKKANFILYNMPKITFNNIPISLTDISKFSCYMDLSYPLFSSRKSVKRLIIQGIKKHKLSYTPEEILKIFSISIERINRPVKATGNERFRVMAAIALCHNKQIFCFPWMSKKLFDGFHSHLPDSIKILEKLNKIILLPKSNEGSQKD